MTAAITDQIDARLAEVEDEIGRLTAAREALVGKVVREARKRRLVVHDSAPVEMSNGGTVAAVPVEVPAPKAKRTNAAKGERAAQILAMIKARPGVTAAEIADALGMTRTQPFKSLRDLAATGSVVKDGKGWKAV
jgi:hypothetical protein